jgi:hypothetical protein
MLCLERVVNDLRLTLAKSMPDQICEPGVPTQKGDERLLPGGN